MSQFALASTGVYWQQPVFNILEDDERRLLLVNPQRMCAVPGERQMFGTASAWLTCCDRGLLRVSFILPSTDADGASTDIL